MNLRVRPFSVTVRTNPNSGDTGGLLANNWTTGNVAKMALLRTDLAPLIGTALRRPWSRATHLAPAVHVRRASVTQHTLFSLF